MPGDDHFYILKSAGVYIIVQKVTAEKHAFNVRELTLFLEQSKTFLSVRQLYVVTL